MEMMFMTNKNQDSTKSNHPSPLNNGGMYEIKIKGHLDDHWKQWFEGMTLTRLENAESGYDCTLIIGPIPDQPALHGLLAKIRDLNLILISVRKVDPKNPSNQEGDQNAAKAESLRNEHL
jgi:hypothetical protein